MAKSGALPSERPVVIRYGGGEYTCLPDETVLDALLRDGADAPYSCRKGSCLSCMMRSASGDLPAGAQDGLRDTLRDQGYFLACRCIPIGDMDVTAPDDAAVFGRAVVTEVECLAPTICRVRLESATPLYYHAGQFINLRRDDGLVRSYSLASVPSIETFLELHVKRLDGGEMSNWIFDGLKPGAALDIQGPNGACYYLPGAPDRPLLLIGNGSGLAPLYGIARDALNDGHTGPVQLYHGSRMADGLYLRDALTALAGEHPNFDYAPCLSGEIADGCRKGRAEAVAFADHPDLKGFQLYLCGYPPMVNAARKAAFMAGAALPDIHADPFELRELRKEPR